MLNVLRAVGLGTALGGLIWLLRSAYICLYGGSCDALHIGFRFQLGIIVFGVVLYYLAVALHGYQVYAVDKN